MMTPGDCTLLIPAAGKGSRLGWPRPKTLYPVSGKPILDHIMAAFQPFCRETVLVVSPEGLEDIRRHLGGRPDITYVIQPEPKGMGEAVALGLEACQTSLCALIWGDQPYCPPTVIRACLKALRENAGLALAMPVCGKGDPYVHLEMDENGRRLSRVLQKREGDALPSEGLVDCSVFFFRAPDMRMALKTALARGMLKGGATGEINFLPALTLMNHVHFHVMDTLDYSPGLNTEKEAEALATLLERNTPSEPE
jgi:CTP:molybdopterin cytidylyltransferase MocA